MLTLFFISGGTIFILATTIYVCIKYIGKLKIKIEKLKIKLKDAKAENDYLQEKLEEATKVKIQQNKIDNMGREQLETEALKHVRSVKQC